MTIYSNLRRNPFTGAYSYRTMDPEVHTIAELAELPGIYGFQLQDKPKTGSVTVTENVTGGSEFNQVTVDPSAGQCRIDYTSGYIVFNVADNGKSVSVDYEGGGSNASVDNITALAGNESRIAALEEDVQATGGLLDRTASLENDVQATGGLLDRTASLENDVQATGGLLDRMTQAESDIDNIQAGWIDAGETWTYASADAPTFTFTVSADVTTKYSIGMKIKLTQTTVKYFIITGVSAYTGGNTTITVYGGTDYTLANAAITSPYFSFVRAPYGFPMSRTKWTVEITDTSDRDQASPTQNTWYNLGSISISIPIGAWRLYYEVFAQGTKTTTNLPVYTTLSTANNSESDKQLTGLVYGYSVAAGTIHKEKNLVLTSKTSYYLNTRTIVASVTSIGNTNSYSTLIIRAVCEYI